MTRLTCVVLGCIVLLAGCTAARAAQLDMNVAGVRPGHSLPHRFAYDRQGCDGANARPVISWSHAPSGTRSFAVSVFDKDAGAHGFWHWMVVNIDAHTHRLPGGKALPSKALALRNDYGQTGWGGPCPPPGPAHHYVFTVYALDVAHVPLSSSTSPAQAAKVLAKHVLAKAHETFTYAR